MTVACALRVGRTGWLLLWLAGYVLPAQGADTNTFAVMSYNVRNWLLMERWDEPNRPKPWKEKQAVLSIVTNTSPDVLGLVEIGSSNDLAEVQRLLSERGLVYPHRLWFEGDDPERHVTLLSRFPLVENHSRRDYTYSLGTNHFRISRGLLDTRVQVNDQYSFRLILLHLKSRRPIPEADQALMRLEEARLARQHIAKILKQNPAENLLVMGDFNDEPENEPIRLLIGPEPFRLFDLLPVDQEGQRWTYYWAYGKQYSRIDYLLASPGLHAEYVPASARIADVPTGNKGSDHRAVYARFIAADQELPGSLPEVAATGPVGHRGPPWWWIVAAGAALALVIVLVSGRRRPPRA